MQAIELLSACQACSKYFTDFDFQQLITLAKELTILHFREREVVLCQGEPATFFGVVLKGALVPVVGDAKMGAARGVGGSTMGTLGYRLRVLTSGLRGEVGAAARW